VLPEPPPLCRLCRQPMPRAAVKCPSCGARRRWEPAAPREPAPRRRRRWPIALYATTLGVALVAVALWVSFMREASRPISAAESAGKPAGSPSAGECAELIAGLTTRSAAGQPLTGEVRDRLRQCFGRR
jgi:hypothetical protein